MGNPDRFAPDADTTEAKDSASRITVPAPKPTPLPAESAFAVEPDSGVRVMEGADRVEKTELERFGSLSRIPRVAIPFDALRHKKLDAPTGFLLALIDGETTFEQLLDVCAMPHVQALRILSALRFLGIIEFEEPRRP